MQTKRIITCTKVPLMLLVHFNLFLPTTKLTSQVRLRSYNNFRVLMTNSHQEWPHKGLSTTVFRQSFIRMEVSEPEIKAESDKLEKVCLKSFFSFHQKSTSPTNSF